MSTMSELLTVLELAKLGDNRFLGCNLKQEGQRVFGGQIIAQALIAAQQTVEMCRHVHSLHGYFLRPGDMEVPVIYEVDRIRDGRRFSNRRVIALQHGQTIFSLESSFQVDETGLEHQIAMPHDVPPPETLSTQQELISQFAGRGPVGVKRYWERERPAEMRPVILKHYTSREKLEPRQNIWFRAKGPLPASRATRAAVLAYLSDVTLLDTATFAHGRAGFDLDIELTSLDHAMWFHREDPLDDWLLFSHDSPSTQSSRGLTRGAIYSRGGTLIASLAQEGLILLTQHS
ncbi:(3S)-malyl-CoA thioesterase [Paraburkholderia sp. BL6665CI2N2]|uniref:acyl-CoA thioesterase n=1 Tax=Paraburkholderia sp. BL6665CI2N2 TaxID=1938806 RepID=UPI001066636A|nr:acyl-CoA thioesterase II [Paraburkholderia sp. BL6665CI2N2]TDY16813.1 (3S)-malyl-CoA thioesterase [Paraburkholderia sp. BL6665CI2N2]